MTAPQTVSLSDNSPRETPALVVFAYPRPCGQNKKPRCSSGAPRLACIIKLAVNQLITELYRDRYSHCQPYNNTLPCGSQPLFQNLSKVERSKKIKDTNINSVAINILSLRVWELVKGGGIFKRGEPLKTERRCSFVRDGATKRRRDDDDTEAEEQGRADTTAPACFTLDKAEILHPIIIKKV